MMKLVLLLLLSSVFLCKVIKEKTNNGNGNGNGNGNNGNGNGNANKNDQNAADYQTWKKNNGKAYGK